MPIDVARAALYRGVINLWVEDEVTRTYLAVVWGDSSVNFLIGGGVDGVTAIVKDAEVAGYRNVFGLIDRDFRDSNHAAWLDPAKTFRRFVLPVHEVENFLLDAPALATSRYHNRKLDLDDIEAHMKRAAGRLCWWAACRDVIATLRNRFRDGFIGDPAQDIDEGGARDHICKSSWYQKLAKELANSSEVDIHRLLADAHVAASASLDDGSWREDFAGKEILRDVGSRIYHQDTGRRPLPPAAELESDLAKDVGAWQRDNAQVPEPVTRLRLALRKRVGL